MRSVKRDLLLAIPCLLLFLATVAVGILGSGSQDVADRYVFRARAAQVADKDPWAILCFRKAEQLSPGDPQVTYDKALCQAKTRPAEAVETMRSIAGGSEPFAPARIWLVRDRLQKGRPPKEELIKIEAELDEIIAEAGTSPKQLNNRLQAMQLAVLVKVETKTPDAVIFYLVELAKYSVVERLRLAKVYQITGRMGLAVEEANLVLQNSLDAVRRKPDDIDARLLGVDACYVLKDFNRAAALLVDGIRSQGQDPRLVTALSTTYLLWADEESKAATPNFETILNLLLSSTNYPRANPLIYVRLASFVRKPGKSGEAARKALIASLARGQSPSFVHLLLGAMAYPTDTAQALRHWQLAADVDPKSYIGMSNLSIGLLEAGDKETAQALINKALEHGDEPQMHFTRSRVLSRLEKYTEALADIEIAIKGMPESAPLRDEAAEIHTKLQQPDLAAKYRREAASLRAEAAAAKKEQAEDEKEKKLVPPPPIVPGQKGSAKSPAKK